MLLNFSLKKLNKAGLVVFLLTQSFVLYAEVNVSGQNVEDKHDGVDSRQRPGRMQMDKEIIPPPPPGPYMSLALSDAKRHKFQHRVEKPVTDFETSDVPLETFSPDVPWPGNIKAPNPWMPEQGYRFVQPSAVQELNRMQPYSAPNMPYGYYSPGYNYPYYQPHANWPPANYYGAPANPANRAPNPGSNRLSYPN